MSRAENATVKDLVAQNDRASDRFEKLYRMLLDNIPSSVLLLDPNLRVLSVNQNFLLKGRMNEADVLGRRLDEVFPPAIYQQMHFRNRVAEVFRTGEAVKGERMVFRAPGLVSRIYYYSLIPFRWGNKIEHVLWLMDDVTDKVRLGEEVRRAEHHLACVVESASDLVVSMDVRGQILTWNTAAVSITGFEEGDVRDRNLCDLCPPEHRADLAKLLRRIPQHGRSNPIECPLVSRAGQLIPISWVCSPMRDANARTIGLVAVGRDLTERRKFEAQLVQSEKLAALGVMASGIAHEIRNPLAVVSSAAQLLLEKPLTQTVQRECADKIHRGVRRAASVIESLLRFARPSFQGGMRSLDLVRVVDDARSLVANQLRLEQIELTTRFPVEPLWLEGNASLLQQLVANLLLNAANAMVSKGGRIELTIEAVEGTAVLRVIDNGRGIPAEDLSKVFDPFFTTMPVGQGTGLGLSISYAIVQQHGGTIEISSAEGHGTTVTVALPLQRTGGEA